VSFCSARKRASALLPHGFRSRPSSSSRGFRNQQAFRANFQAKCGGSPPFSYSRYDRLEDADKVRR